MQETEIDPRIGRHMVGVGKTRPKAAAIDQVPKDAGGTFAKQRIVIEAPPVLAQKMHVILERIGVLSESGAQ
jgi:hypothetical protein